MKKLIIFSLMLFMVSSVAMAQSSSMTDDQVMQFVVKEHGSGTSNAQIVTKLMQRGVDISQIRRVRTRYEKEAKQGGLASATGKVSSNGSRLRTNNGKTREDYGKEADKEASNYSNYRIKGQRDYSYNHTYDNHDEEYMDMQNEMYGIYPDSTQMLRHLLAEQKYNRKKVFGRDIFNNKELSFEPNMNIATPQNYRLGPGDAVIIDIYGASQRTIESTVSPEDFREGLTAVISIKVAEPQFEGQTKTKLGNSEVQGAVQQAVNEALSDYLEEHPDEAKRICEKVVLAATARIAARKARESVQRKNFMTGGGLPGKLADCSMKDPKECEIFLVEGDSAGGSAKQGRDRFRQAILPLRGKILNVEKVQWHKVFEAESVMNIIQSIGVRFGVDGEDSKEANTDKLRYDKIIIMTDADVDGSHIDTLIMTLFYRFMPKVIEEGHLYIATPPLYKCTYRSKVSEYCYTEQQRQAFIDKYGDGTEDKNIHTQRYKGLGEMNPEQLWETTMDPATRLLKQVTIENAAQADEIFSMLISDDVEPRREFIEQNATYANIDA